MGKYSVSGINHITTTGILPVCGCVAGANEEGEIVEMIATGSGVQGAADTQHTMRGTRLVNGTPGVFTSPTPTEWNEKGNVAQLAGTSLYTTIPAVLDTVHEVMFGFNQRGGMRWAVPRGEGVIVNGDETKVAYVMTIISSVAGRVDGNLHWWEPVFVLLALPTLLSVALSSV